MATLATVIFLRYPYEQLDYEPTALEYGLHSTLTRIGWSISLCYIIFACIHNSGGIINEFLGHPLWQPMSRLSYAIYMLHYPVIRIVIVSTKSTFYYTELMFYQMFFGIFVLSIFVSIIGTLAFESPIAIFQKLLFQPRKKDKSNEQQLIERK